MAGQRNKGQKTATKENVAQMKAKRGSREKGKAGQIKIKHHTQAQTKKNCSAKKS